MPHCPVSLLLRAMAPWPLPYLLVFNMLMNRAFSRHGRKEYILLPCRVFIHN